MRAIIAGRELFRNIAVRDSGGVPGMFEGEYECDAFLYRLLSKDGINLIIAAFFLGRNPERHLA